MQFFGLIISERTYSEFNNPLLTLTSDLSTEKEGTETLIVGYETAKEYCKEKKLSFDILEKKIKDKIYWTFDKTERRSAFFDDFNEFMKRVTEEIVEEVKYYYVNPFKISKKSIKKTMDVFYNGKDNNVVISDDMAYCLYDENNILGISLRIMDYAGFDVGRVTNKLRKRTNVTVPNDKLCDLTGNKRYLTPYLLYKGVENR